MTTLTPDFQAAHRAAMAAVHHHQAVACRQLLRGADRLAVRRARLAEADLLEADGLLRDWHASL